MTICRPLKPFTSDLSRWILGASGVVYLLWKTFFVREVDFKFIWWAGKMWQRGDNPYSAAYFDLAREVFTGPWVPFTWVYGPNWWPIARALAAFDFETATVLWRLTSIALIIGGSVLLQRSVEAYGYKITVVEGLAFMGVVCFMQATAILIASGQTSAVIYAGLCAIVFGLMADRALWTIAGLTLILLKPNIGLAFLPALIIYPRSRIPTIVAIATAGLMSIPALIGHDIIKSSLYFLEQISSYGGESANVPLEMTGLRHILYALVGANVSSLVMTMAAALLILGPLAVYWNTRPRSAEERSEMLQVSIFYAIATAGAILSLHAYDLIIIAPLVLLSSAFSVAIRLATWVGFLIVFRSGNLATLLDIAIPGLRSLLGTSLDSLGALLNSLGALLMFGTAASCLFFRHKLNESSSLILLNQKKAANGGRQQF
jgi:hypothetical protein